jgi:pSer/pThr/pTyr-binding forkhead associated (FHA) protein
MTNQTNVTQPDNQPEFLLQTQEQQNNPVPVYELIFTDASQNIENRFPIEDGKEVSIGAGVDNDIIVEDQYMSGKHFIIRRSGNDINVQDNKSRNGLYIRLDDAPVSIVPGQVVLAGKTSFKVEAKQ